MLRLEARSSQVPIERKPPWIKTRLRTGPSFSELKSLVRREGLHTVCEEAGCPNIFECWEDREATFLVGGISAPGGVTSARSRPAGRCRWMRASRAGSRSRWPRWGCGTRP